MNITLMTKEEIRILNNVENIYFAINDLENDKNKSGYIVFEISDDFKNYYLELDHADKRFKMIQDHISLNTEKENILLDVRGMQK